MLLYSVGCVGCFGCFRSCSCGELDVLFCSVSVLFDDFHCYFSFQFGCFLGVVVMVCVFRCVCDCVLIFCSRVGFVFWVGRWVIYRCVDRFSIFCLFFKYVILSA